MFLKVPVLATKVGGVPEFITDGENGWLFDPNDVEDLIQKLNQILSLEEKQRNEIGTKGYEKVIRLFTVENYIKELEKLYAKT